MEWHRYQTTDHHLAQIHAHVAAAGQRREWSQVRRSGILVEMEGQNPRGGNSAQPGQGGQIAVVDGGIPGGAAHRCIVPDTLSPACCAVASLVARPRYTGPLFHIFVATAPISS